MPPAVSLTPLDSKKKAGKRKRRPNFRPTPQTAKQKARTAAVVTQQEEIEENGNEEELNHDSQLVVESEEAVADTHAQEDDTSKPAESLPSGKKKVRKRRITGVAIGATRITGPAPPNKETATELALGMSQPEGVPSPAEHAVIAKPAGTAEERTVIPEDTSGLPALGSFCKVKTKRKKSVLAKNSAPAPNVAAEPLEPEQPSTAGPTVRIVDGEIVLQKSSMIVNARTKEVEQYPVVEEEAQPAVVGASYTSFVKKRASKQWPADETELFYEALRQVGMDFSTMEAYFGNKRTRKQLKKKYQMELAKHPDLVNAALDPQGRKDIDLSVFEVTEEDITAVVNSRATESEEALKENNVESEKATGEDSNNTDSLGQSSNAPAEESQPKDLQTVQTTATSLWGEEENEDDETAPADPVFEDMEAVTTSLTRFAGKKNTRKKTRPRFRSTRKK